MTFDTRNINQELLGSIHHVFERGADRANMTIGDTDIEKRQRDCRDGGYKCIHLPPESFCAALSDVLNHCFTSKQLKINDIYRTKFIDIGCGVGEKVYLASLMGLATFGLELRQPLIDEGKQLFNTFGSCRDRSVYDERGCWAGNRDCFIQANALTYDYKEFDILYFYCPLIDQKLQQQLEEQILNTAKPGAVVIPALPRGCFETHYGRNVKLEGWECHPLIGHHRPTHFFIKNKA